jgi:hypothetical protein
MQKIQIIPVKHCEQNNIKKNEFDGSHIWYGFPQEIPGWVISFLSGGT